MLIFAAVFRRFYYGKILGNFLLLRYLKSLSYNSVAKLRIREKIATHILLIFTIFLRENLQDKRNMSNFAHEFLKLLSYKDIK